MFKLTVILVLLCIALACGEPRVQQRQALSASNGLVSANHPYLFLSVPRGRSGAVVKGFEIMEDEDDDSSEAASDDDDNNDDEDAMDDDDDDEVVVQRKPLAADDLDNEDNEDDDDEEAEDNDNDEAALNEDDDVILHNIKPNAHKMQLSMKNAKPTQMMVSREHAGAIMVPDGVIEIEGQSIIDEKTGKAAILVPRSALDAIPDGSVVALMERSLTANSAEEEARANRVMVRRRRKGSRRNVRRGNGGRRRRRGGNKKNKVRRRRRGGNRKRVVRNKRRRGGRRGGNRRRRRPVRMQG